MFLTKFICEKRFLAVQLQNISPMDSHSHLQMEFLNLKISQAPLRHVFFIKSCAQIFVMQYLFLGISDNKNTECLTPNT